ncbi:MAG: hypothetical protein Q7U07_06945 [Gammaproteobacteria bacterium]|nr:hypothetical protein [Gammaproteobacteria bacterium]
MVKVLYLIHAASAPQRLAKAQIASATPVPWMFLCQDYARHLYWERTLGANFAKLPLRDLLVEAAAGLRQPFLDLLSERGRKHDSLAWWASRVSERNTAVSPLFLYCCYLKIGQVRLARSDGPLVIVGESYALLSSLASHAEQEGYAVQWLNRPNIVLRFFRHHAIAFLRAARFLAHALVQTTLGPPPAPLPADRPSALLHTFLDEQCLGKDGEFHDRYLPGLCTWLEGKGLTVTHMPILFNMRRSKAATWCWLASSRQRFINPYRCYRISDYLAVLVEAMPGRSRKFGPAVLGNLDASALFSEAQANCTYDGGTLESLLSYRLPLRLRERGIKIDLFVAEYENMITEKLLIAGFRKYSPNTKLVGFQHGALYPMLLCNFITREEAQFAPMPDRIVCNGPFFRDILIREGLPADRAVAGPALRYSHLWRIQPNAESPARQGVFVPLPMMQSDATELLTKLIEAFGAEPQITLSLKPHPMSSSRMLEAAGISGLPQNFRIVSGEIGMWLSRAQVVVALSSSALYEALAAGVLVVPVGREAALDLNPLAWHPRFAKQYCSAEEIRSETTRLMHLGPADLQAYREHARQILDHSFGQINEDTMNCFIDGLLPAGGALLPR